MALIKGSQVFRYMYWIDSDGLEDTAYSPEARFLRNGLAVNCVLEPDMYDYYRDKDYAFIPYKLTKTLLPARPGDIVRPGEAKYIFIENGGEPLYLIQKIHLTNKRTFGKHSDDDVQPAKKKRRASAAL
jgi:hypothetical protein